MSKRFFTLSLLIVPLLLALLLQAALPGASGAEERKRILFAVDPTYPPLEFMEDGDRIVGYGVDYFTAVCQEAGLAAEFRGVEWDGIFDRLNAGEFDAIMSSVTITPERRQTMDFTIPYYIVRQSLFVPQNSNIANIRQLAGLKVGSQEETTATGIIAKISGAESAPFPIIEEAFKSLATGEVDAVICEDVVGASFLKQPEYAGKIKMASVINTPGAEELYGAAVKKGNLEILTTLNDGVKAVKAKGLEADLYRKWIGS